MIRRRRRSRDHARAGGGGPLGIRPWDVVATGVAVGAAIMRGWTAFFLILGSVLVGAIAGFIGTRMMYLYGRTLARSSVQGLTSFAARLAGPKRLALRDEWCAHLAGDNGHDPVTWSKVRQALGFITSAARFRLADAADLVWRPVDAMLGSRILSSLFVVGPVIAVLFAIVHHDGRFGLVTDIQDVGELGAFLYAVIRVGRWWRQIKLPEPRPRRAKE